MLPDSAKVSDLFFDLGWNSKLVDEVFLPFEVEYIKLTSLRGRESQDKLVWSGTKMGGFLVQSAYKLGIEIQKKEKCGSSSSLRWSSFWKKLWSAKVPHKIRIFMWRACSNILPTCTRLFERKIGSNYSCPVCFEEAETTAHIFMECKVARSTWNIHTQFA